MKRQLKMLLIVLLIVAVGLAIYGIVDFCFTPEFHEVYDVYMI